jgi:hypothetical protein
MAKAKGLKTVVIRIWNYNTPTILNMSDTHSKIFTNEFALLHSL